MTIFLFFLGFVIIIKGADLLVEGASGIAGRFGIPDLVIGLTVVSFGTSMPETAVSVLASLSGHSDLAVGNILGSNIANVLLVLGCAAVIAPLPVRSSTVLSEIPFSLTAALLVGFLANATLFTVTPHLVITRAEGFVMLFFMALFLAYIFKISMDGKASNVPGYRAEVDEGPKPGVVRSSIYIVIGSLGLYLGGKWIVEGAIEIAFGLGLSESLVAMTIVAIGTSLPELVTSAVAALKRNTDIAVGNVIGSNIFNLLWVLGLSAVVAELPFEVINNLDILMVIFSSTLVIFALVVGTKGVIDRWNGIGFVLLYAAYLGYLINRG